ncbi:hypothetical protein FE236_00580 [Mariprofundus erugo]|uniref:hypothetical protein n=1 Tax=Mariprofundus erugo TaxID=2528639 RepID=UPI0010FCF0CE|nr:hypothetical protein [Mariprofundus erugo]TLS78290.1 hypothetical protein FE236_00580 [Mariprofundus erugo]
MAGESRPDEFRFDIGGCFDGMRFVGLRESTVVMGRGMGSYADDEESITPSDEDWRLFVKAIDQSNVWKWKRKYVDPNVLDGTEWNLVIRQGEAKKKCYGSNDYPPEFDALIDAINLLVKREFFER